MGAPLCFIVQARPVKQFSKELFYVLLRNPPSIVLSLLPAPQQAMLSLSDEDAMRMVYGEDAPVSEEQGTVVVEEKQEEQNSDDEDEEEEDTEDDDSDDDDED
jgi:hypothetical protein